MDAISFGLPPSFNRHIARPRQRQNNFAAPSPIYPPPVYQDAARFGQNHQPPQPYHGHQQDGHYPLQQQGYPQQGYLPPQQQQQGMYYQQQGQQKPWPPGYSADNNGGHARGRNTVENGFLAACATSLGCICCLELCIL